MSWNIVYGPQPAAALSIIPATGTVQVATGAAVATVATYNIVVATGAIAVTQGAPPTVAVQSATGTSHVVGLVVNDGSEKFARSETRFSNPPSTILNQSTYPTTNTLYDGTTVSVFGALGEWVQACFWYEADASGETGLTVTLDPLTNGSDTITTQTRTNAGDYDVNSVTNYTGRNIEVFIGWYLQVLNASAVSYNSNPLNFPIKMQGADWAHRPMANQWLPEWLVPQEWYMAGFNIPPSSSQLVWVDIFIPKTAQPNTTYHTTVQLNKGGKVVRSTPLNLQVYNFTLPDVPSHRFVVPFGGYDIAERWGGAPNRFSNSPITQQALKQCMQMLHRNRLVPVDPSNYDFGTGAFPPIAQAQLSLNGSLYTSAYNYDGPGYGTPDAFFTLRGGALTYPMNNQTQAAVSAAANAAVNYFLSSAPFVDYGFFSVDEPSVSGQGYGVNVMAVNNTNPCTFTVTGNQSSLAGQSIAVGGGEGMPTLAGTFTVTSAAYNSGTGLTTVTIPFDATSAGTYTGNCTYSAQFAIINAGWDLIKTSAAPGNTLRPFVTMTAEGETMAPDAGIILSTFYDVNATFGNAVAHFKSKNAKNEYGLYNGHRPAYGSFALEDDGVSPRVNAYIAYKKKLDLWYFWNADFWRDYQTGRYSPTVTAATFGNPVTLTIPNHKFTNGQWVICIGVETAHLYQHQFLLQNVTTNTVDLYNMNGTPLNGTGFGPFTTGGYVTQAQYTDLWNDPVTFGVKYGSPSTSLGPAWGALTSNGDGVLLAPGMDALWGTGPNVRAPVCSMRVKLIRRGVQDYEYFVAAKNAGYGSVVDSGVAAIAPIVAWECVQDPKSGTYANAVSWPTNPDTYENFRKQLANLIAPPPVSSGVLSASGSFTVNTGSTADVVVSGLSFKPTLVLFYWGGQELYGVFNGISPAPNPPFPSSWDMHAGFGAMNATDQFSNDIATRWGDGRRDGGSYASTCINTMNYTDTGAVLRRRSINADGFTLECDAAPTSPLTVNWVAFGGTLVSAIGCVENVTTGTMTLTASFAPTGAIIPFSKQAYQTGNGLYKESPYPPSPLGNGNNFAQEYAAGALSFGVCDSSLNQSAVSGWTAYGGFNFTLTNTGYTLFGPGYLNGSTGFGGGQGHLGTVTSISGNSVTLNVTSVGGGANLYLPYILLGGCKTFVTQAAMQTSTGLFNATGAAFTPVAALFGCASQVGVNGNSIVSHAINGGHDIALGFATANGQGGVEWTDLNGVDDTGALLPINPVYTYAIQNGTDSALHNSNFDVYTGAILRGKKNTGASVSTPGTFSTNAEVKFSAFLSNGVQLTQTVAAAVAGKITVLMIG